MHRANLSPCSLICWIFEELDVVPPGRMCAHFWVAVSYRGLLALIRVRVCLGKPVWPGGGKLGTPCARMQRVKASSRELDGGVVAPPGCDDPGTVACGLVLQAAARRPTVTMTMVGTRRFTGRGYETPDNTAITRHIDGHGCDESATVADARPERQTRCYPGVTSREPRWRRAGAGGGGQRHGGRRRCRGAA
jgi:hypothetical protein